MNIEEENRKIIASKMHDFTSIKDERLGTFKIHQPMIESVQQHRNMFGISSRWSILRQLVKTRKLTKTIRL